jgi:FdhE protein
VSDLEVIPSPGVEPAWLRLPDAGPTFRRRSARFLDLAPQSSTGEYLEFLGRLANAQRRASEQMRFAARVPSGRRARPLDFSAFQREPAWRDALREILVDVRASRLPRQALEVIEALQATRPEALETLADRVLSGALDPASLPAGPFVAAALQVYWTSLAALLPLAAVERDTEALARDACPVCGAAPVAGVVQGDDKIRYLTCSLCSSAWHVPRIRCVACGDTKWVSYLEVEGGKGAARAEACDACHSYLKLFYLERDTGAEPHADDVATLALDLLVADGGYRRAGSNLLLLTAA